MSKNLQKSAFIPAAGFGTRLKPLTDNLPKALVNYKGLPMIENVISKLISSGYKDIFINSHHFHDKMSEYFTNRKGGGNIKLIFEKEILGTGGAIKNAQKYLNNSDTVLIYNTDVDCDLDITDLELYFSKINSPALLCVQKRETSRYLLCDNNNRLIGRFEYGKPIIYCKKHSGSYMLKAFCGIHIIRSSLIDLFPEPNEMYDIIPEYMKLISEGYNIFTFDISDHYFKDLGIPKNL